MDSLVPANTRKARASAFSAFARFLVQQDVREDYVHACIAADPTGMRLVAVLERFGLYLVSSRGKDGAHLSPNSVLSYFRGAKGWMIDRHPIQRVYAKNALVGRPGMLERACKQRSSGGFVHSAPPCTKEDLKTLIECIYVSASSERDYQDAALFCLMWQCFGRASDLAHARKEHLALAADGTLFVRLLRVKTAQEQGLSLVQDRTSFVLCPLFTVAAALAIQSAPSHTLLSQLPALVTPAAIAADDTAPLYALLETDVGDLRAAVATAATSARARATPPNNAGNDDGAVAGATKATIKAEIGVHGYLNRLLKRLEPPRPVTEKLTSHSFRRGGAQHANGCDRLSAQWILDRGGWSMSATNKGFAYIFNTPREDRKVARVLSGWAPEQKPAAANFAQLDTRAQEGLGRLRARLFAVCSGHDRRELDVDSRLLDTLTATLVRHYPRAKALMGKTPLICRIEECAVEAGYDCLQLLAWSAALDQIVRDGVAALEPSTRNQASCASSASCGGSCTNAHSAAILAEVIAANRTQNERLRVLESMLPGATSKPARLRAEDVQEGQQREDEPPAKKRKKAAATNPATIWYEWYAKVPRLWETGNRSRRSDARMVVAFVRLFVVDGYKLSEPSASYRDDVQRVGAVAESALFAFLRERLIKAASYGTVLRAVRTLHRTGALNDRIVAYRVLRAAGRVDDPSPPASLDILAPQVQPTQQPQLTQHDQLWDVQL